MSQHAIPAVVNYVTDNALTTLESAARMFPGQAVAVAGSVIGGLLLAAAGIYVDLGQPPGEFAKLADAYVRKAVADRAKQGGAR